jgi:LacI family transcriptional regulator
VQRFARDTRLDIDPKLVIDLPDQGNPNAGVDDASRITEELLKQKRTFTALMAYDDMTAFGALRGLAKAGIKVPQECSVIGFDDVNPSHLFVPALTTVRQPMEAMGASAVSILLQGISSVADNRSPVAVHRKLPAELVVRESTEVITR